MLRKLIASVRASSELRRRWSRLVFPGSAAFWEQRYRRGGDSGDGSYGVLAQYKADVLNELVEQQQIAAVIELGCGDGNQLSLARYPRYLGLDVSRQAIARCAERFQGDPTKSFLFYDPAFFHDAARFLRADCALSLDVIYHLVEDETYDRYLAHLFGIGAEHVVIYSSDTQGSTDHVGAQLGAHVCHRAVAADVRRRFPDYELRQRIENPHADRTFAHFMVFARASAPTAA